VNGVHHHHRRGRHTPRPPGSEQLPVRRPAVRPVTRISLLLALLAANLVPAHPE
jgi:hypothetical protein